MEPGLQVISESKEVEEDRSLWKVILLGLLGIGAGFGVFHYFESFLINLDTASFWMFVVLFVIFLDLTILQVLLVKNFWKIFLIGFLEVFSPIFYFQGEFGNPNANYLRILILSFCVGFYFVFIGLRRGYRMAENSLKIRFFEISRRILPRVASGLLLILATVFYLSYFSWNLTPPNIGQITVGNMLDTLKPVSNVIFPSGGVIDKNENVSQLVQDLALAKVKETKVSISDQGQTIEVPFLNLPQEYKTQVVNQVVSQIEGGLKSQFSTFDPNDTVLEFVYSVLNQYFLKFELLLGVYAPVVIAFGLFFLAKGTLAMFYWLIELIAFLILKMLLVFGFAYTNLETRAREFLLLS